MYNVIWSVRHIESLLEREDSRSGKYSEIVILESGASVRGEGRATVEQQRNKRTRTSFCVKRLILKFH